MGSELFRVVVRIIEPFARARRRMAAANNGTQDPHGPLGFCRPRPPSALHRALLADELRQITGLVFRVLASACYMARRGRVLWRPLVPLGGRGGAARHLAPGREHDRKKVKFIIIP